MCICAASIFFKSFESQKYLELLETLFAMNLVPKNITTILTKDARHKQVLKMGQIIVL